MRQQQFPLSPMYIEELWTCCTIAVAMVISSIVTITCSSIWAQPNWCGDSVVQMICNIPTFQACKSSFYRNQAKTTPKLRTSQKEINLDQLEKDSSSVTALMPRGTEMTEFWYFQRTQTFNVCSGDNAQWWNLLFAYKIINTDIHPRLWALPKKIDGTYNRFFALLKYVQYVSSSLCNCLNIGNWTSISLQESLCTPTSLRHWSEDVFPQYAGYMEEGLILWIGSAIPWGWWLPSPSKKRGCSLPLVPEEQVKDVWLEALSAKICRILKTTWQTPRLKAIWWTGTILTAMDHDQQTQLQSGIINVTVCVGAFNQMCACLSIFFSKGTSSQWSKDDLACGRWRSAS